ncbi:CHAD domain-containing protein [Rhodobacter sp. NSM]|uniref:CHAD domain-containing protein n=1 Tax=Rhodobacter sp. NSM TaxID=3457501 RepID=UPI003FCFC429
MAGRAEDAESAGESAEAALRRIAGECCAAFDANLARLMEETDPEGPHKARVALRRLRTALTAFDPILDPGFARKAGRRARTLFRIVGDLRDADVLAEHQEDEPEGAAAARDADRIRQKVRKRLRREKAVRFAPKIGKTLAKTAWRRSGRRTRVLAEGSAALVGGRALGDAWATCLSHGDDLSAMPDEDRHELRKDLKTMRYTVEFFGEIWSGEAQERFLARMKDLQDELGHLNDLAMLRREGVADDERDGEEAEAMRKAAAIWSDLGSSPVWWQEGAGRPSGDGA